MELVAIALAFGATVRGVELIESAEVDSGA